MCNLHTEKNSRQTSTHTNMFTSEHELRHIWFDVQAGKKRQGRLRFLNFLLHVAQLGVHPLQRKKNQTVEIVVRLHRYSSLKTYSRNECFSDKHAKDVSKGDRLAAGLLGPQSLDVVGDVLWQEQAERVAAHALHQLLIDLLRAFLRELWV